MIAWGSGMRDEAALGLVRLLARPPWRDSRHAPDLVLAIENLLTDPNPVVRMQAARGLPFLQMTDSPEQRHTAVRDRLLVEDNQQVLTILLDQLRPLAGRVPCEV